MVEQMFEAVHFDTPFNQILEEAAEWKQCEREQANKKKARQLIKHCIISSQAAMMTQDYYGYRPIYI